MTTPTSASLNEARTSQLFLIRGVVAIAWAVAFVVVAGTTTTSIAIGTGILLVLYPLIDAAASLLDAGRQQGLARQLLVADAAVSIAAAIALGVAAAGSVASVFAVFAIWAAISGVAQLVIALRRRAQFGKQWPMLLAGGVSVLWAVVFIIAAARDSTRVFMLAIYAAGGGAEFIIQAWLLSRRRRHVAPAPAHA